jgi:cytidylate kinase
MTDKYVIAIDGPAGSGKSTTASGVARRLGIVHLDTGAMYRAVTFAALEKKIEVSEVEKLAALSKGIQIGFRRLPDGSQRILADGRDVTAAIRGEKVTARVSAYCAVPQVRKAMVALQRAAAQRSAVVLEGRDIGTVVFPRAEFKFFITASLEARARRRLREFKRMGVRTDLAAVTADIAERDKQDSGRAVSPLKKAGDAVEIDTTGMTVDVQIEFIVRRVEQAKGNNS